LNRKYHKTVANPGFVQPQATQQHWNYCFWENQIFIQFSIVRCFNFGIRANL